MLALGLVSFRVLGLLGCWGLGVQGFWAFVSFGA